MPHGVAWTVAEEKAVVKAIAKAKPTTIDALVEVAKKTLPRHAGTMSRGSLDLKFKRMGLATVYTQTEKFAIEARAKEPKKADAAKEPKPSRDELLEHRLRLQLKEAQEANEKLVHKLHVSERQNEQLRDMRAMKPLRPIQVRKGRGEGKQRQGVPVMLCSDWHIEEPVDPAKVNGLNRYNLDIADDCITKMADAWEWMLRDPRYDCREGVVWLGGDLFSGHIHEELVEKNFLSPIRATAWLLPRLEAMLRRILASSPRIERLLVPCNDGNHGRMTNKIRIASRTDNSLEWLLYFNLAERLRDEKRIEFQIAEGEYNYLKILDQNLCFFHGDSVKYAGGVGGILVPMKRGLNELRKYPVEAGHVDVFNVGHFHQYTNHGDVVVNGSMIGVNPYSMRYKLPPEPRQQAWYMLDATRGKCLSAPIWLPKTGLI